MCKIIDPDPSGLFQSPSNSLRRLYLESSIRPAGRVGPTRRQTYQSHLGCDSGSTSRTTAEPTSKPTAEPASEVSSEPRRPWPSRDRRTDRGAHGEAHGGADEQAHWACARPSSGVFNLTSTTHTPVHGVLSRARARLCLAGRSIGPILVRVF